MKFLLIALLPAVVYGFTALPPSAAPASASASASSTRRFLENRINEKIDLESPKVATMETLEGKTKKVYCRCWQSGTFPLCDGSHMKHNEATGDNVGPLIVTVKVAEA